MSTEEYTWREVREFVAHECGVAAECLTLDTTLFGDLGIDGDDAYEFFEAFQNRFGVALEGFEIRRYFGPEGWPLDKLLILPLWMLWMARPGEPHKKAGVHPIRLSDLVAAVGLGRWEHVSTGPTDRRPVV